MPLYDDEGKILDHLRLRKGDYSLCFNTPAGSGVLLDLAKFCRANASTFHPDPRMHAVLEGRREVWLRIQQHLNLTSHELFTLFRGNKIIRQETDDE